LSAEIELIGVGKEWVQKIIVCNFNLKQVLILFVEDIEGLIVTIELKGDYVSVYCF
jgi:hypothetical protein